MIVESKLQFFLLINIVFKKMCFHIIVWGPLIKYILFATFSFGWVVGVKKLTLPHIKKGSVRHCGLI